MSSLLRSFVRVRASVREAWEQFAKWKHLKCSTILILCFVALKFIYCTTKLENWRG